MSGGERARTLCMSSCATGARLSGDTASWIEALPLATSSWASSVGGERVQQQRSVRRLGGRVRSKVLQRLPVGRVDGGVLLAECQRRAEGRSCPRVRVARPRGYIPGACMLDVWRSRYVDTVADACRRSR
eukprot:3455451-Prymnesium_polylepis.1